MSNNTTAEQCLNALNETIDCIPLESSSLIDDIEIILLAIVALAGIGSLLYKKYLSISADGKITLDELLDSVSDVKEAVKDAEAEVQKIEKTLESHSVVELKEKLKSAGLSVQGKKADLIQRLKDAQE
tara:strand:+ start:3596 stop:3979 length:384 start_codon:yes stop_codon:yes gene_type:complete